MSETSLVPSVVVSAVEIVDIPDGEVIRAPGGGLERLVHDRDEEGNVVGWHKEHVPDGDG